MRVVLTGKEMQEADHAMIEQVGIPSAVLMERAALSVAEEVLRRYGSSIRVGVFSGMGNNGADGTAAARILKLKGVDSSVYFLKDPSGLKNEAKRQYQIAKNCGVTFCDSLEELGTCDVLIDAVFGTGLSRLVEGETEERIREFQNLGKPIVSVDIPSGISSMDGTVMGTAVQADVTVTFAYEKTGILLYPGRQYCGDIVLRDVGIRRLSGEDQKPGRRVLEDSDVEAMKPWRFSGSNKGSYGHVLVIAGSYLIAGAACMAAKAALLAGAGLVKVLTEERNREIVQALVPEALIDVYGTRLSEERIREDLAWADVVLMGPGLGTGPLSRKLFHLVMDAVQTPMVLDADGLNLLSEDTSQLLKPHLDLVLTPHIGEMARLQGVSNSYVTEHMIPLAEEFSRDYQVTTVLKNATTVVSVPYGNTYLNLTGNNGMSTGGSGDVLAGLTAGLMAQKLSSDKAAPLAVYLHGKAGDLAAEKCGVYAMGPKDILDCIHEVLL